MDERHYLGKLCRHGHEYENTGKSLRYLRRGNACVICKREQETEYKRQHPDKAFEYRKRFNANNKDKIHKWCKLYHDKNIDKINENNRRYQKENYGKYREQKNRYARERRASDPKYKLSVNFRVRIGQTLKEKKNGNHKWEDIVGYTTKELIEHLEGLFLEGMNWDNYGKGGWELDHVIPMAVFNFDCIDDIDFKRCWALENLQPLWAKDNHVKSDKITKDFQPNLAL